MAWIFSLWVEAEKDFEKKAIKKYFNGKIVLANDKKFTISANESGIITVDGISKSGITSQSDANEMTSIGFEFYSLLKNAPNFRFAIVGVEAEGFALIDELADDPEFYLKIKGFVINNKLYKRIKGKQKMKVFSEDYLWTPYCGETWNDQ